MPDDFLMDSLAVELLSITTTSFLLRKEPKLVIIKHKSVGYYVGYWDGEWKLIGIYIA